MSPPFTIADFLAVFAAYNAAIWPFHLIADALGLLAIAAIFMPRPWIVRLAFAALAILWAFTGISYHLMFFSRINPIAPVFTAFFVLQGILFLASAMRPGDLRLQLGKISGPWRGWSHWSIPSRSIPSWGPGPGTD